MTKNTQFNRIEKYDALQGKYIRDIKANDVIRVSTVGVATGATAGSILCSRTNSSTEEVYITGYVFATTTAGSSVAVAIGNSTVLPVLLGANTPFGQVATRDAPILKLAASEVLNVVAVAAGTYTASLWGVREPTFAKVETT